MKSEYQKAIEALPPIKESDFEVVNWFQSCKSQPPVLLRVLVTNKNRNKISVHVSIKPEGDDANIRLPHSDLKDIFFDNDTRCLCHLQKIDPVRDWGKIKIDVQVKEDTTQINTNVRGNTNVRYNAPTINISGIGSSGYYATSSNKN